MKQLQIEELFQEKRRQERREDHIFHPSKYPGNEEINYSYISYL